MLKYPLIKQRLMKPTLLVIDMQNDFTQSGAVLEVKGIRKQLKKLNSFIAWARTNKILVIYTRHTYSVKNNPIETKMFPHVKDKMRKGSFGWQICAELKPAKGDIIIDKTRYDAFYKTNLDKILRKQRVDTVIITGTMTNVCCESTARSAMYRDYNVIFCSDLTFCSSAKVHKNTLGTIKSHFGKVMNSRQVCKQL